MGVPRERCAIVVTEKEQERVTRLLLPLFGESGGEMQPATDEEIRVFLEKAQAAGVPLDAAGQLADFYRLTNGVPCLDSLSIHACDDELLYEWWQERELWLGTRDDDVLRWWGGKFCLGDASRPSYDAEYECASLVTLLEKGFAEWYPQ